MRGKKNLPSWNKLKQRIRYAYPGLRDSDLEYIKGYEDQLLVTLEKKTGKGREELISWLIGLSHL